MIFALRLLLGIGGERFLPQLLADSGHGFANAVIASSTKIGAAPGILVGGLLSRVIGRRPFFFVQGRGYRAVPHLRRGKTAAASRRFPKSRCLDHEWISEVEMIQDAGNQRVHRKVHAAA